MINWIKKIVVRFLTRKVFVVSNKATLEHFILSHITDDGYVSLLTDSGSYLPVSYSVFKRMFQPVTELIDCGDELVISGIQDNKILLSTGSLVPLYAINEQAIEDSFDSNW
jgi:hypothetical protein